MNINNRQNKILYLSAFFILTFLLIREYTYIHPYNTDFFILGPNWTYSSTKTFTWWLLLIGSLIMMIPILRKQKIGFLGLVLLASVAMRPIVQNKFPEETASKFFEDRAVALNKIVKKYSSKNRTIVTPEITDLDFEKLIIKDSIYYFLVIDEEWPYGLCYSMLAKLPRNQFDLYLKYSKLKDDWYEFDY